jgi:hypothetical protein
VGYTVCTEVEKCINNFKPVNLKRRTTCETQGTEGRLILKWTLRKQGMMMCTELNVANRVGR